MSSVCPMMKVLQKSTTCSHRQEFCIVVDGCVQTNVVKYICIYSKRKVWSFEHVALRSASLLSRKYCIVTALDRIIHKLFESIVSRVCIPTVHISSSKGQVCWCSLFWKHFAYTCARTHTHIMHTDARTLGCTETHAHCWSCKSWFCTTSQHQHHSWKRRAFAYRPRMAYMEQRGTLG